jgi:hypothetical protein
MLADWQKFITLTCRLRLILINHLKLVHYLNSTVDMLDQEKWCCKGCYIYLLGHIKLKTKNIVCQNIS